MNKENFKKYWRLAQIEKSSRSQDTYTSLLFLYPSIFNYWLSTWGCAPKGQLEKVFRLQKRAIRIIDKKHDHSGPLFIKYNILPLDELYKFSIIMYMFKVYKGYLPQVITDLFSLYNKHSSTETRLISIFVTPFTQFSYVQKNIHIRGPLLFNQYCAHMDLYCSLYTWKKCIKKTLFSKISIV